MTTAIDRSIRIRSARVGDIETLVEFNQAMARETEHKALDRGVLRAGVAAVFAQPQRGFYRVAERGADVVGCLMVTFEWSDWRNGDIWWLQSVYVHAEHRRAGVFAALYRDVERRARATAGVIGVRLYVEQDNAKAQRVYASFGMERTNYRLYEVLFS